MRKSKICSTCKEDKDFISFSKRARSSDGYEGVCKQCLSDYNKAYRKNNPEKLRKQAQERARRNRERNLVTPKVNYKKTCPGCKETKDSSLFYVKLRTYDGLSDCCKSCSDSKLKEYEQRNPERTRKRKLEWKAKNIDRHQARRAEYYEENRESIRRATRERRASNRSRTLEQVEADRNRLRPDGIKKCRVCREPKPFDQYRGARGETDGLAMECNPCRIPSIWKIANLDSRGLTLCVYCGGPFEHVDHVLPRALGGKDIQSNLVSSCADCNQSKGSSHPMGWLKRKYPEQSPHILLDQWGIDYSDWKIDETAYN